jgi:prepilin-type N-terminal cleavage/methylation domain-containing protein
MNKSGFTLIEIMVAIAIIAVLATVIVPNLRLRNPKQERLAFIARLNLLVAGARQNALLTHQVQRVSFDMSARSISVTSATGAVDGKGEPIFERPKSLRVRNALTIPETLVIKNFYIEGFDEMGRYAGRQTIETYFYVMSDGSAQPVIINILDTKDRTAGQRRREVGLVLNPFNAQFKEYDTFQKP